jgi:hypothetical protein
MKGDIVWTEEMYTFLTAIRSAARSFIDRNKTLSVTDQTAALDQLVQQAHAAALEEGLPDDPGVIRMIIAYAWEDNPPAGELLDVWSKMAGQEVPVET